MSQDLLLPVESVEAMIRPVDGMHLVMDTVSVEEVPVRRGSVHGFRMRVAIDG